MVRALLEVGGRELVMLTDHNGVSVLYVAAIQGHLDVARALMEVGGRELAMLPTTEGSSALVAAAAMGHLEVMWAVREVGGRELAVREAGGLDLSMLTGIFL